MDKAKELSTTIMEIDRSICEKEDLLIGNNATMDSPLVDDEGFPIAELDTYLIKKTRQEINCLLNDRKELEKQMVTALGELDKAAETRAGDEAMETGVVATVATVHRTSNDPIARVGAVGEGGAASRAGIHIDDQVIQFGELHAGNFTGLHQMKDIVSSGEAIKVTVFRESSTPHVHRLVLTPTKGPDGKTYALGCEFTASTSKRD